MLLLCAASWLAAAAAPSPAANLSVEVFKGRYASVNSFLFSNGRELLVLDVQRKPREAGELASLIESKHLPLRYILISHGHTDHFTGMALLHERFPQAEIVVASEAIRKDIKDYAIYMDNGGATPGESALEPALRPRSASNPGGFDYENTIHVLPGPTLSLPGGGTLELSTDYPPTEAPHMTTVYCRELNALFIADFGYNKIHAWVGDDITRERVIAWRGELARLESRYAGLRPSIYPGHGDPTDMTLFPSMMRYLDDFMMVTARAPSREAAQREMQTRYPSYGEADFFLKYSVANHVKD